MSNTYILLGVLQLVLAYLTWPLNIGRYLGAQAVFALGAFVVANALRVTI